MGEKYEESYFDLKMALRFEPLKRTGACIEIVVTDGNYWGITIENLSQLASRMLLPEPIRGYLMVGGCEPGMSEDALVSLCRDVSRGQLMAEATVQDGKLLGARLWVESDTQANLGNPSWSHLYDCRWLNRLRDIEIITYQYGAWDAVLV